MKVTIWMDSLASGIGCLTGILCHMPKSAWAFGVVFVITLAIHIVLVPMAHRKIRERDDR